MREKNAGERKNHKMAGKIFNSPINLCYCERIISLDGKEVGPNGNEEGSEEAGEKSRQEEVIFGGAAATPPLLTSTRGRALGEKEGSVPENPTIVRTN